MAIFHWLTLLLLGVLQIPVIGKMLASTLIPAGTGVPDSLVYMGSNSTYCKIDGKDGDTAHTSYGFLKFQGDAGNATTAQCVAESALTLVFDRDRLPKRSDDGFGTPAEMLGEALLHRFQSAKARPVTVETSVDSPIL